MGSLILGRDTLRYWTGLTTKWLQPDGLSSMRESHPRVWGCPRANFSPNRACGNRALTILRARALSPLVLPPELFVSGPQIDFSVQGSVEMVFTAAGYGYCIECNHRGGHEKCQWMQMSIKTIP